MSNTFSIIKKTPKVVAETLKKGKDGTMWYVGCCEDITDCKAGDFCFDPDNYDIYRFVNGSWGFVCNLNNLDKIQQFIDEYQPIIERLIKEINNSPAYKSWWFGTKDEYNAMTQDEKTMYELHFIEEGS